MLSIKQSLKILNDHRAPGTPEYTVDDAVLLRGFCYRLARAVVRGDVTREQSPLSLIHCSHEPLDR